MKPNVFIGSSREALHLAEAVFEQLSDDTNPTIWKHGLFLPGKFNFETLEEQLKNNDFAIMIATPDDFISKRGQSMYSMRDNVLLEYGLFTGLLGRKRTYLIIPESQEINIPEDIVGIITAKYDDKRVDTNILASVQIACTRIQKAIQGEFIKIKKERTEFKNKFNASKKGKALKQLHDVVTQLRDAILLIQNDILEAVFDQTKYEEVKKGAIVKINEIYNYFSNDAQIIGIEQELSNIVKITIEAIQNLPFPEELAVEKDNIKDKAINLGLAFLNDVIKGNNAEDNIQTKVKNEAELLIGNLKKRFSEWWDHYFPIIQKEAFKLQDALFGASINLINEFEK